MKQIDESSAIVFTSPMATPQRNKITLSDVPDKLHERIKKDAKSEHRSLPSQVIHTLESVLLKTPSTKKPR